MTSARQHLNLGGLPTISSRVHALRRHRQSGKIFGSDGHGFKLNPPLSDADVIQIESQSDLRVPVGYRYFLTRVGNRGAGPGYGLFPLGSWGDTAAETMPWDDAALGSLADPFPHQHAWNLPATSLIPPAELALEQEGAWFQERDERYFDPSLINGSIPIGHLGCAIWMRLVVTGTAAGQVWADDRASDAGIYPCEPADFISWYQAWLADCERLVL